MKNEEQTVSLVLGSSGARGYAHIAADIKVAYNMAKSNKDIGFKTALSLLYRR